MPGSPSSFNLVLSSSVMSATSIRFSDTISSTILCTLSFPIAGDLTSTGSMGSTGSSATSANDLCPECRKLAESSRLLQPHAAGLVLDSRSDAMWRAAYVTAVCAARRNIARLRNGTCYGKIDMCDQATSQVKVYRRNQWQYSAGDAADRACYCCTQPR